MKGKSRIILLGPYPPPYGGVAIYLSSLFYFLREKDVQWWAYGTGAIGNDPNVYHVRATIANLLKLIRGSGKNAVIVDCSTFFMEYPAKKLLPVWLLVKFLARFRWIKVIHDGTLPTRYEAFGLIDKFFVACAKRFVDQYVVVNQPLYTWIEERIKTKRSVVIIGSLLPTRPKDTHFEPPSHTLNFFNKFEKVICSVGVFTPSYGFDQLVSATESLRESLGIDFGLILIDGAFACEDEYKAQVLQGRSWILTLTEILHEEVLDVLQSSDLFVRCVAEESYGISKIEALLSGTPVVATKTGETRGTILFDYGNVANLSEKIKIALAENPQVELRNWKSFYEKQADINLGLLMDIIDETAS